MKCERCHQETNIFTMSMFNTQNICMSCKERERKHPMYENAREAERQEILKGNYNYSGIGKPHDL